MRLPRARLIVAWSSLALQERSAVALSCLAVLLGHSAGVRERLHPSLAQSIAVQRSLQARAGPRASLAVVPERLCPSWAPSIVVPGVPATGESLRAWMHLQEVRSAAVDSYPPLERFAAGWWVANLGHSYPKKPGRQARGMEQLRRSCSKQQECFARKAPLAWAYRCRGRESAAAVAGPEKSVLCRHLAWCWDRLRLEWGSRSM
ncbi:MAG TPA: hypothetical protein VGG59_09015 [Acidobacteriaceae bacterium]